MVVFYLRNSRIPSGKVVPVTVALTHEAVLAYQNDARPDQDPAASGTEFPNLLDPEGDEIWFLTLSTTEPDVDGDPIPPEIVNVVSEATLHLELEAALGRIGQKVDWGTPLPDIQPPKVVSLTPALSQTTDVPITSPVVIRLRDPLPAAGIDLSTLNVTINDFPIVTSGVAETGYNVDLSGNVFDLTILHRPKILFG